MLRIFCSGAVSQVDTRDWKPELEHFRGKSLPEEEYSVSFQGRNGNLMKRPRPFRRSGRSGKAVSTLLPHLSAHEDDMAFIHSMVSRTSSHCPGCVFMDTGFAADGFPSGGARVSHALGSENDNLPACVVIPDIRRRTFVGQGQLVLRLPSGRASGSRPFGRAQAPGRSGGTNISFGFPWGSV